MGLKYGRIRAVALTAGLILSLAGAGAALAVDPAADDIAWNGVARIHWVDRVDGAVAGALIRISYYREGDEMHGIVPGEFITNSRGVILIIGLPRSVDSDNPVLLDIDGRLSTATLDDAGCTTFQSFFAAKAGVTSRRSGEILLQTNLRTDPFVNCPEPEATPVD
jgi:hypothetical protein